MVSFIFSENCKHQQKKSVSKNKNKPVYWERSYANVAHEYASEIFYPIVYAV